MHNPTRRRFLAQGAAALAAPFAASALPAHAASGSPLRRYPWHEALALWEKLELGPLRAAYVTLTHAECPGLTAPEATALALADFAPLLHPRELGGIAIVGGKDRNPVSWTCTCTSRNGVQIVVTLRASRPMPPVLRGANADLEVRHDELLVLNHGTGSLSIPLSDAPAPQAPSPSFHAEALAAARSFIARR